MLKVLSVDEAILKTEIEKFSKAAHAFMGDVSKRAEDVLSPKSQTEVEHFKAIAEEVVSGMTPPEGGTAIDTLNRRHWFFIHAPIREMDFSPDKDEAKASRYLDLAGRFYKAKENTKAYEITAQKLVAKDVLFDFIELNVLFHDACKPEARVPKNVVEFFLAKAREFIEQDRGNVVAFNPMGRKPK